jgi:hypothetical protein
MQKKNHIPRQARMKYIRWPGSHLELGRARTQNQQARQEKRRHRHAGLLHMSHTSYGWFCAVHARMAHAARACACHQGCWCCYYYYYSYCCYCYCYGYYYYYCYYYYSG